MLRSALSVVLLIVSLSRPAAADEPFPHVRGLDAWAREAIERGVRGSPLIRELIASLDRSDVIVHVETAEVLPRGLGGMTRFATASAGVRYVRVTLDRRLLPDVRSATLAHELQHANELAHSNVTTRAGVQQLYEDSGFRTWKGRGFYETTAAEEAGARAWAELRGYCAAEVPDRARSSVFASGLIFRFESPPPSCGAKK